MSKFGRIVTVFVALLLLSGPVGGQPPQGAVSDLDDLLGMIGQGGVVNNQMLFKRLEDRSRESAWYVSGTVSVPRIQKKETQETLSASGSPEVKAAVRQLKPAIELLDRAAAAEKKGRELISKLSKENGPDGAEFLDAATDLLHGLDAFDLDELVRAGRITREEADEYQRLKGQANANFMKKFTKSFGDALQINTLTFQQTHRLRNRSEVLQNKVVAEVLAPALRARSGKARKSPPVQVNWALFTQFDQGLNWSDARINVRSTTDQELTRLTLLFDFQTPQGSRQATIYIPKLGPTGGGQLDPVALSWMYLNNPPKDIPKDLVALNLDNTRVRCSVWCDQFRAEGLEPTALSREELVNDIRLLALQPGLVYSSQGGEVLNPNEAAAKAPPPRGAAVLGGGGKSTIAPYRQEYEPDGRFELICRKLVPVKQDHQLELELIDHLANPRSQLLRGIVTLPTVKFNNAGHMVSNEEVTVKVTAGKLEWQMKLMGQWRDAEWRWQAGQDTPSSRGFYPDTFPAPGSPDAVAKERLTAAMILFCEHKYAEARQAYDKISADQPPDSRWNILARRCISFLKEIDRTSDKSQQARAEAMRKTLEHRRGLTKTAPDEADKKPASPPMESRPRLAKSDDSPKRKTTSRPSSKSPRKADPTPEPDAAAKPDNGEAESVTRVTVDDVEYVYLGIVPDGISSRMTILATSKKGDRPSPNGMLTLIDDSGETHAGRPLRGVGAPPELKAGVPVKLVWLFGGQNAFTGEKLPPPPAVKIKQFASVSFQPNVPGGNDPVEFRNVPSTVKKSKSK